MNTRTIRRISGHGLALLAGGLLAWQVKPATGAGESRAGSPDAASGNTKRGERPQGEDRAARSRNHAVAWEELASRKLTFSERTELQKRLLREWVEIDPEAAIRAALDCVEPYAIYGPRLEILEGFNAKMRDDPELFWRMIRDKRFGLHTGYLRNEWIRCLGESDPSVLASYFGELAPQARAKAVGACLKGLKESPEEAKELLGQLSDLPDTPGNRALWRSAGTYLSTRKGEELVQGILESRNDGERMMYREGFKNMCGVYPLKMGVVRGYLDALPEALRKEVALEVLGTTLYPMAITDVAELLMDRGEWEDLARLLPERLKFSVPYKPEELAGWATTMLPERDETVEVYRAAVGPAIDKDPGKAREWIQSLPEGWQRDHALVEYVDRSLNKRKDEQGAAWAMAQLGEGELRESAAEIEMKWQAGRKR